VRRFGQKLLFWLDMQRFLQKGPVPGVCCITVQIVLPDNRMEKLDVSQALQLPNTVTILYSAYYEPRSGKREAVANFGVGD
jgi:hypothetical protein